MNSILRTLGDSMLGLVAVVGVAAVIILPAWFLVQILHLVRWILN